jgi:hypothetical protein
MLFRRARKTKKIGSGEQEQNFQEFDAFLIVGGLKFLLSKVFPLIDV